MLQHDERMDVSMAPVPGILLERSSRDAEQKRTRAISIHCDLMGSPLNC